MDEWDETIHRLARQSYYSDGASGEELSSAINWRRFLYGEKFNVLWKKALKDEYVTQAEAQRYKQQKLVPK